MLNTQRLIGNEIVSSSTGEKIGKVQDVLIDADRLQAAAVVTSKGNLFDRSFEAISDDWVRLWGRDVLLVKQSDVIVQGEDLADHEKWLSVSDTIRGYDVVREDGTRAGTLDDVALDDEGKITGYELSDVAVEEGAAAASWIGVDVTRSLGPDVLVIKSTTA